jgi:DNA-binding NtrC family response regulator
VDGFENQIFKVLIVDDEEGPRRAMQTLLSTNKELTIQTAESAFQALELLKASPFDLVITDIRMPGMDGLELLKEIKTLSPDTMVILMTGYGTLENAIDAIRGGAYDYLTKPFRLDELRIMVEKGIDKLRIIRENRKILEELRFIFEKVKKGIVERRGDEGALLELLENIKQRLSRLYIKHNPV